MAAKKRAVEEEAKTSFKTMLRRGKKKIATTIPPKLNSMVCLLACHPRPTSAPERRLLMYQFQPFHDLKPHSFSHIASASRKMQGLPYPRELSSKNGR
jgi:hypothetical protein